jgi:hypothetical protein
MVGNATHPTGSVFQAGKTLSRDKSSLVFGPVVPETYREKSKISQG